MRVVLLALLMVFAAGPFCHAGQNLHPVVLVPPPTSPEVWGDDTEGHGLLGQLRDAGYVWDENLFVLSLDQEDVLDPLRGAGALHDRIEHLVKAGIRGPFNLVGYSLGGLIVSDYLQRYAPPQRVETAVLISTPLAGSFLATYYRRQWEVLYQEARARGGFPWLLAPGIAQVPHDQLPAFTSESEYVTQRALGFYAPLYGQYVLETRWLGLPSWVSRHRTFETYLFEEHTQLMEEHLLGAALPPLGVHPDAGIGHDLSRAFYELMALDSGRRLYLMEGTGLTDIAVQVFGDGYLPTSPQDALVHYGTRLAQVVGGHLLQAGRAPVLGQLLGHLGQRLGYDPEGTPLRRVQLLTVPLSSVSQSDGSPGFVEIPANHRLSLWHQWRQQGEGPRVVALTSKVAHWLKPLAPASTANDLVVEVSSALPAPGPDDVFRVWSGIIRPDHFGLLSRADVQEFIVKQLHEPEQTTRSHWPLAARTADKTWSWQESGRITTSTWRPSYLHIGPERLQGIKGEVYVEFRLPSPPEGGHWLLGLGANWERVESGGVHRVAAGMLQRDQLVVSLRPVMGPGGSWEQEHTVTVPYTVQFQAVYSPLRVSEPPPPETDPIRVVYRNKRTTQRHEDRTYHERWVWDMGDGTVKVFEGQEHAHMGVKHMYHQPGTYQIQAVAYDNHGRIIRNLSWVKRVEAGPQPVRLLAMSIIEPDVTVTVRGPVTWVTGRPATFSVEVETGGLSHTRREVVSVDPGVQFRVFWERPGFFTVQAAATVRITYEFPEGVVTVTNTYVGQTTVRVLAPALVQ